MISLNKLKDWTLSQLFKIDEPTEIQLQGFIYIQTLPSLKEENQKTQNSKLTTEINQRNKLINKIRPDQIKIQPKRKNPKQKLIENKIKLTKSLLSYS